jgi:hypothetical protein
MRNPTTRFFLARNGVTHRIGIILYLTLMIAAGTLLRADIYTVTNQEAIGPGSIDEAVTLANSHGGPDQIHFNIPGPGPHVIVATNGARNLAWSPAVIDATTQPGYAGTPLIVLDGQYATTSPGIGLSWPGCTVRGLAICRFSIGMSLLQADGAVIESCNIYSNEMYGINVFLSPGCRIGGSITAAGNMVSANGSLGLYVSDNSDHVSILGNRIGTDPTGTTVWPNSGGIVTYAPHTVIGTGTNGEGNVISGSTGDGLRLQGDACHDCVIEGNTIGPDITGMVSLSSNQAGIVIMYAGTNPH